MATTWKVLIDWNVDGDFTDTSEDITNYVLTASWNIGFSRPYMDVADESRCTITLRNDDKRFSPEYASSPLYGKSWNMRPMKITANIGAGEVTMWEGYSSGIAPEWNTHSDKQAILTGSCPKPLLQEAKAYLELMIDVRSDEILTAIFDQFLLPKASANKPWAIGVAGYSEIGQTTYVWGSDIDTNFETGAQTFPYAGDNWEDGIGFYNVIQRVTAAERGKFFFNRSGVATFWNRHHFISDTALDATLTNSFQSFDYAYAKDVKNRVNVDYNPRAASGTEITLWVTDDPIRVKKDQEKTIRASFNLQDSDTRIAAYDVVRPNEEDGTLVFSRGDAKIIGWKVSATSVEATLLGIANDTTITTFTIKGKALTSRNKASVLRVDPESVIENGVKDFNLSLEMIADEDTASSIADYELARRSTARGIVRSIGLRERNSTNTGHMINRTVGDRIRLIEAQTAHDEQYFIVGEQHRVTVGLNLHETTWVLEPADMSNYWLIGVAGFSEIGETTLVGPL